MSLNEKSLGLQRSFLMCNVWLARLSAAYNGWLLFRCPQRVNKTSAASAERPQQSAHRPSGWAEGILPPHAHTCWAKKIHSLLWIAKASKELLDLASAIYWLCSLFLPSWLYALHCNHAYVKKKKEKPESLLAAYDQELTGNNMLNKC